jgi:hypothetical protein
VHTDLFGDDRKKECGDEGDGMGWDGMGGWVGREGAEWEGPGKGVGETTWAWLCGLGLGEHGMD